MGVTDPTVAELNDEEFQQRRELLRRLAMILICAIGQVLTIYKSVFLSATPPIPYHTSALSGEAWVLELMTGHPERIRHNLGVSLDVFQSLLDVLRANGHVQSRNGVSVEEQLAIFLYICTTGLSTRLVGERFQRSPETISRYFYYYLYHIELIAVHTRYFKKMLFFFSSSPFYSSQVQLPTQHSPIPFVIQNDPRYRFFENCIGAVDGTHIRAFATLEDHPFMRNRKGFISQNCLFICDFDFLFIFSLCGWDGSAADGALWHDARMRSLRIPHGKYFLADAGFGTSDTLLVPYRNVRYHLKEWRQSNIG